MPTPRMKACIVIFLTQGLDNLFSSWLPHIFNQLPKVTKGLNFILANIKAKAVQRQHFVRLF